MLTQAQVSPAWFVRAPVEHESAVRTVPPWSAISRCSVLFHAPPDASDAALNRE